MAGRISASLVSVMLIISFASEGCAGQPDGRPEREGGVAVRPFEGAWQQRGERSARLCFDDNVLTVTLAGTVNCARILKRVNDEITLRYWGRTVILKIATEKDIMIASVVKGKDFLATNGKPQVYDRLPAVPTDLIIKPSKLGKSRSIDADLERNIREEIKARYLRVSPDFRPDQEDGNDEDLLRKLNADNAAWLKEVISQVGWIDVERFGVVAAEKASSLVDWSEDLSLTMAVLPEIEKDVMAKRIDGQLYVFMYDKMQIRLGKRQRFGTVVVDDDNNRLVVLPLESREQVDNYRKRVNREPLKEYVESLAKGLRRTGVVFLEEDEQGVERTVPVNPDDKRELRGTQHFQGSE